MSEMVTMEKLQEEILKRKMIEENIMQSWKIFIILK